MTIVGFDTSLATTTVCVLRHDGRAFTTHPPDAQRLSAPPEHSAELLPELERVLAEAEVGWADVEALAVGVGPGTFTGLRIGVATARALAQALGLAVRPVSSLAALAAGMNAAIDSPGRSLVALIDARRGQVFTAAFRSTAPDDAPEQFREPAVMDPEGVLETVRRLDAPLAAGDWALESRRKLDEAGAEVPASDSGLHAVSALQVCRLGARAEPVALEEVHPLYLRLPDAEVNRRLARQQDR
jgi:tRNA threonylcarbamoyladenosine biosynthesis protein TsaB